MIHHTHCPICRHEDIRALFKATDFTVSKKDFSIWTCTSCHALFTQDVPSGEEIGAYYKSDAYISHSDTRKGVINALYHRVRSITLQSKYQTVCRETGLNKGTILDIGCGTGAFLDTMIRRGWEGKGLEPDQDARERAKQMYGIDAGTPDELFSLEQGRYHAVTMWHVLEHVHELHRYIDQIKAILKPGGRLLVAVPNHQSADAAHYGSYWAAYDVPRHLYHFSPDSMNVLMKQHGLRVIRTVPMWFDSFYVSMLSEGYKQSKPFFLRPLKGAFQGLVSNMSALFNRKTCSSLIYVIGKD